MYKFALDADALIKLTKSGLIFQIVEHTNCILSDKVYKEVVVRGKERLYEDAFVIEHLVEKKKIMKIDTTRQKFDTLLSSGEISTLELYKKEKVDAIISDDRRFLSLLDSEKVPFIVPTQLIAVMSRIGKIKKQDALSGLNKIRPFVREDAYLEARAYIIGKGDR